MSRNTRFYGIQFAIKWRDECRTFVKFFSIRLFKLTPPIQIAVMNGLGDVIHFDIGLFFKVGYGAGNFQDAIIGPGESPSLSMADSSKLHETSSMWQYFLIWRLLIWTLQ